MLSINLYIIIFSSSFSCSACCGCCGGGAAGVARAGVGDSSVVYIPGAGAGAETGDKPRVVHLNMADIRAKVSIAIKICGKSAL